MNAVSELISDRRKLVREAACLAAEGRLFQRTAPLSPYSRWKIFPEEYMCCSLVLYQI